MKTEFVDGMRVTDEKTLAVVEEELEKLNAIIVSELQELGQKATGFSSKDSGVILARKRQEAKDLGLVGRWKR